MAKLTREEVIARVRGGKSLAKRDLSKLDLNNTNFSGVNLSGANLREADLNGACLSGANLSGANLSGADLCEADLFRADLSKADIRGATLFGAILNETILNGAILCEAYLFRADLFLAKLKRANLRESNLGSANFEDADLSGADLTGANIWNIATADWKIDGVKCEYAYNCKAFEMDGWEKTRRDFKPGEFEQIYKSFPKLELIFKEEFSHLDHRALLAVIDRINEELPNADLNLRKMERVGNTTTATLATKTIEDAEKTADMLPELFARMITGFEEIQGLLVHQNPQLPSSIPDQWLTQIKETIEQAIHPPDDVVCGNQSTNFKEKFVQAVKHAPKEIPTIAKEILYHTIAVLISKPLH
jgi:uncharacterized protein YjbI with pentapeptide repeats